MIVATTKRKNNERNYVNKKHRGVERRILIGSRVSAKVQKLILNSKGLNYRRVRESLFRNAVSSVSTKKFHVKFDDEQSKELYSNRLTLENYTASIPVAETLSLALYQIDVDPDKEAEVVITHTNEVCASESQDLIIPHPEHCSNNEEENAVASSNTSESMDKRNDRMNADNNVNIDDLNASADLEDSSTNGQK